MKSIDTDAFKAELVKLYTDPSKHSAYQSIPDFVSHAIGYQVRINEDWRGDRVRLEYILARLPSHELHQWGDFGANTGFFSLSLAHDTPTRQVLAIEANPNHANFIQRISDVFEINNISVAEQSITIDGLATIPRQDVLLHLNVLHHAGADFDKGRVTGPSDFLAYAQTYLERLHACTRILVFQVGTNLWGDKSKPIIDYREDAAKYELLSQLLLRSGWKIDDVAYAKWREGKPVCYQSLSDVMRDAARPTARQLQAALNQFDLSRHLGEFYRRPLFICSSPERIAP
jgi:hypothetical protein